MAVFGIAFYQVFEKDDIYQAFCGFVILLSNKPVYIINYNAISLLITVKQCRAADFFVLSLHKLFISFA